MNPYLAEGGSSDRTHAYLVLSYRSKALPMSHFALEVDIDVWNFLELRLIIELALHHSRRVEGVVDENR